MRPINEKLAADLLEAGKQEFLAKGFRDASMRNIAARLGVTTGAIYRYYSDKEALFDALVSEAAGGLVEEYRRVQREFSAMPLEKQLENLPKISDDGQMWMMEYLYDHFDAFKLIACHSAGTSYEHYLDILIDIEVTASHVLLDNMTEAGMQVRRMDEELLHIVASALFSGMFETIRHDMPRKKAIAYMESLRDFYGAGWMKLLGLY